MIDGKEPDKCCELGQVPYEACQAERYFDRGEERKEAERKIYRKIRQMKKKERNKDRKT